MNGFGPDAGGQGGFGWFRFDLLCKRVRYNVDHSDAQRVTRLTAHLNMRCAAPCYQRPTRCRSKGSVPCNRRCTGLLGITSSDLVDVSRDAYNQLESCDRGPGCLTLPLLWSSSHDDFRHPSVSVAAKIYHGPHRMSLPVNQSSLCAVQVLAMHLCLGIPSTARAKGYLVLGVLGWIRNVN
jgi:hypothetical protein